MFDGQLSTVFWTDYFEEEQMPQDENKGDKPKVRLEIETYVDENLPTIFFTQAFCSKTNLAKYLANKYQGLYIDIDAIPSNSAKAKIEAFLKLR